MKKAVILSILGLTAGVVSSYGQGSIAFNTYTAMGGSGILVTFGNGPSVGAGIDSTFTGELLWSLTNPNDVASTAGTAGNALNSSMQMASVGGGTGGTGTFNTLGATAGYIIGNQINLTAAQLGGATTVYCEMVAFNGAGWNQGSTYQGHSASFAVSVATGTTLPSGDQLDAMAPFQVFQAVPEPATMALGGLGLASLLVFRRKKA